MTATVTRLKDELADAREAKSLIDNKQLRDAFKMVEKQYLDAMLTASEKDDLGRFRFAEAIKVVRLVRRQLAIAVESGKLSKAELDIAEGKKRRFF